MENVADVIVPVSEELVEMGKQHLFIQLYITSESLIYHAPVFTIEEVLMIVDEGEGFFDDLDVRGLEKCLQHIQNVHIVHMIFKHVMRKKANFGVWEEGELCLGNDMIESCSETTVVGDYDKQG